MALILLCRASIDSAAIIGEHDMKIIIVVKVAANTARDQFSSAERVQMAAYLAWADNLKGSERELRAVLAREPKNREARTHLARVLSWQNELSEAIEEADKVLKEHPNDREGKGATPNNKTNPCP